MMSSNVNQPESFTGCYRAAQGLSRFLFRFLMPITYHDVKYVQQDAPFILIANHQSMLDPLIIGWKCERYQIRYLGKKELVKGRLMKAMFENLRMIPVQRHNMDMGAMRACFKALKEGHVLGIFPEGTRYKQGVMEDLESGVAMILLRGKVPVVPAYVAGKPRLFHRLQVYYAPPIPMDDLLSQPVDKDTCEAVLERIRQTYREQVKLHASGMTKK